jgi:hypothetical protein
MKTRGVVLAVVIFLAAVFLINRLRTHTAASTDAHAVAFSAEQPALPAQLPVQSPMAATAASVPQSAWTETKSVADFQREIVKCFGSESAYAGTRTSEQLVNEIVKSNPILSSTVEVENIHLRLKDGSERRMHLIPSDRAQNKNGRELRLFSLDSDGLPVLIPLPKQQRNNPTPAFLESLQKEGTRIFHQVKEVRMLKDGSHLSVNTIDDKVFEFQLFGREKSFSCRGLDCLCH